MLVICMLISAATFDETFGGLLFALKRQRRLPFWVRPHRT